MMVPQEQEIFAAYEQTGQESVISATASVWQERRAAEKQLKERVQSVLDTYGCCEVGVMQMSFCFCQYFPVQRIMEL